MIFENLPYLLPYFASIAIALAVAVYTWRHRRVSGAAAYTTAVVIGAASTIGYILELLSNTIQAKGFWDDFQWVIMFWPVFIVLFALQFTGRTPKRQGRTLFFLMIFPTIFMMLVATNSLHGLIRPESSIVPGQPFDVLVYDFTPLVYLSVLYLYGPSLYVVILLTREFFKAQSVYRSQIATIFIGMLAPLLGGVLTLAGVEIGPQRDITPYTFAIGNIAVAWGLFRFRLFELVPVARDMVIEFLSDAVFVLNDQHLVVDVNPAGARLLDQKPDQMVGKPALEIFANWKDIALPLLDIEQARSEIEVGDNTNRQYFEVVMSSIKDRRGHITGRVVMLRDITEQKLAHIATEKARQSAEEANRAKSQFLASMSHELRTPLNSILTFNELLMMEAMGPVNEEQKDFLGKTLESGRHLLALINDVLDITKLTAGMMQMTMEEGVDLRPEITAIRDTAESLLKHKPEVTLVMDIDHDLPGVIADRRRVRQIMLNLVSNACKFTEEGTVTISAKQRGDELLFAVTDTGPGVPADQHEAIFQPFIQTESGIAHASGTGLGLAIARRLTEAHQGQLWLESEAGEGAAFYFAIPAEPAEEKVVLA